MRSLTATPARRKRAQGGSQGKGPQPSEDVRWGPRRVPCGPPPGTSVTHQPFSPVYYRAFRVVAGHSLCITLTAGGSAEESFSSFPSCTTHSRFSSLSAAVSVEAFSWQSDPDLPQGIRAWRCLILAGCSCTCPFVVTTGLGSPRRTLWVHNNVLPPVAIMKRQPQVLVAVGVSLQDPPQDSNSFSVLGRGRSPT